MNRLLRIILWTLVVLFTVLCFVVVLPSLFGLVIVALLAYAIVDYAARRRRNATRALNSVIRSVCHHDGALTKVALAFSKSGPLRGPCYEYSRRLMMGQDALEAAARSQVPLQLATAVALRSPAIAETDSSKSATGSPAKPDGFIRPLPYEDLPGSAADGQTLPAYGQLLYLMFTAVITCLVLTFMSLFIMPTMEVMFEEFGMSMPNRWMMNPTPAYWLLAILSALIVVVIPLLSRGSLLGIGMPSWMPTLPGAALHKADVLEGLADAIDQGWPMGKALAVGHMISIRRSERQSLQRSMELIEQGRSPADAIQRTGWISQTDAAWIDGATPQRTAQLLRTIGQQGVRDANSNVRWIMSLMFPSIVLLLSASVLAQAYGFFSSLFKLIVVLA